jgi:hypothetical protein
MSHRVYWCVTALLVAGCFRTTVHSGLPPGDPAPGFRERWHHGFVFGLVASDGPYPLERVCPNGWSELRSDIEPLQVLAFLATLGVYAPQRLTIVCALESTYAVPRSGHPPPPPSVYP